MGWSDAFAILHVYVSVWRGDRGPIDSERQDSLLFHMHILYFSGTVTYAVFDIRRGLNSHTAANVKYNGNVPIQLWFGFLRSSSSFLVFAILASSLVFGIYHLSYSMSFVSTRISKTPASQIATPMFLEHRPMLHIPLNSMIIPRSSI